MASLEADLAELSYRDLQHRAKEAGVKATGKAEEIIERILAFEAGEAPPPSTVKRRSGGAASTAAKTPRTSRKAAAPSIDKAALLRAAASTPLPAGQREAAEEEPEEEEQPRSGRSTVRRRLSAQQAKSPARTPRSPSAAAAPRRRPTVAGLATPVFWLVLLTAGAAGLAALAVPFCQQNDCVGLARNLPGLASDAAAQAYTQARVHALKWVPTEAAAGVYAAARARALAAADALQEQWHSLTASVGKGDAPACHFHADSALHSIMPVGEEFEALRAAAASSLSSDGTEPADKATVALFVCEVADDCHSALRLLDEAVSQGERCVLHLDGRHLGTDRGALQAQLAAFLTAAPSGVVLLRRIDQMSPELLPVLINALSEQGAFQQDGTAVTTTRATFLLTSLMPGQVFQHLKDEIRFKQEAKTRLVVDLALRAEDKETTKSQANALRRRVDFVIPIGSDPSAGEAGAFEAAEAEAGEEAAPTCALSFDQLLDALLPEGQDSAALHQSAQAAMEQHTGVKPPVALFACWSEEGCATVVAEAERAAASPESCLLVLEGGQVASMRALLEELVTFIRQVPGGTVIINRLDQLHTDLLSVLVDGLGHNGSLNPADNSGAVDTVGTTFLLTSKLPMEAFANAADETRFRQDTHQHMVADFRARATNLKATAILAEALQQRINTVLPVGSDPVEYEAWQAEQDGQQQEAAEEEEAHEAAVEEEAQAAEEQREAAAEEAQVGADVYAHQPDPVAEAVMQ